MKIPIQNSAKLKIKALWKVIPKDEDVDIKELVNITTYSRGVISRILKLFYKNKCVDDVKKGKTHYYFKIQDMAIDLFCEELTMEEYNKPKLYEATTRYVILPEPELSNEEEGQYPSEYIPTELERNKTEIIDDLQHRFDASKNKCNSLNRKCALKTKRINVLNTRIDNLKRISNQILNLSEELNSIIHNTN